MWLRRCKGFGSGVLGFGPGWAGFCFVVVGQVLAWVCTSVCVYVTEYVSVLMNVTEYVFVLVYVSMC